MEENTNAETVISAQENIPETAPAENITENTVPETAEDDDTEDLPEDTAPETAEEDTGETEKHIRTGVYMTDDVSPSDDLLRRAFGLK